MANFGPAPARPWVMAMTWHDLAFLHWPADADAVRGAIERFSGCRFPAALEIDTREGQAWIGIVPFRMSGVRARFTPALPGLSRFPELNLPTYVRHRGADGRSHAGVYFFSLDAFNRPAVATARATFRLNYQYAEMSCRESDGWIDYQSRRCPSRFNGGPTQPAEFRGRYRGVGEARPAEPGTLAHWLTERYVLFSIDRRGTAWMGEIYHVPWPLQLAECSIERETISGGLGIALAGPPLAHFARRLDVRAWWPRRIGNG
jgi:uncharacterized protein